MPTSHTLLEAFLETARSTATAHLLALECNSYLWSYSLLDHVSNVLSDDLRKICSVGDTTPVVAVVSANNPYTVALLLATWKIHATFAPLDVHAPSELLRVMLINLAPAVVVYSSANAHVKAVVHDLSFTPLEFGENSQTPAAILGIHCDSPDASSRSPSSNLPSVTSNALYLHTSSATGVDNLKCVPITHESLAAFCHAQRDCLLKHCPDVEGSPLRVLGWSPFSHILAHAYDLGAWTFLSRGCYVFPKTSEDAVTSLINTIVAHRPNVFSSVPWILQEIMSRPTADELDEALRGFKMWISAGAQTDEKCLEWAKKKGLKLFLNIGMTETGPLFNAPAISAKMGWSLQDDQVTAEAELRLVNEADEINEERGELVVVGRHVARGYLNRRTPTIVETDNGRREFWTGDVYRRTEDKRLVWEGRKEDIIQLVTGDKLDPRPIEMSLLDKLKTSVTHVILIGDNFLAGPSSHICAFVEPVQGALTSPDFYPSLTSAFGNVNKSLVPPLRITWRRITILEDGSQLPMNNKMLVNRKKLSDVRGLCLAKALATKGRVHNWNEKEVDEIIVGAVARALSLSEELVREYQDTAFAELGMDSATAVSIVKNINDKLGLCMLPNTCHIYIDLRALLSHIIDTLRSGPSVSAALPAAMTPKALNDNIVIVGQMLRLPGDIHDPAALWDSLVARRTDIMIDVPLDRWDHASFYRDPLSSSLRKDGDITFKKAGFINVAEYDNQFFAIPAPEAIYVSPSNRLALEAGFVALENANIPLEMIKGTDMGIFVASGLDEGYGTLLYEDKQFEAFGRHYGTGLANSAASGRLSYLLDVHGPSITIDTACSGGLVAMDSAVKYLTESAAECALVIATNTHTWPGQFAFLSANSMSSINSRCATFTDMADGYVPSEGVAAFVLKKEQAAVRDRDNILALIKATAVGHNGRSQGVVAPNQKAQITLQRKVIDMAGLKPSDIDFVEAHGTGTTLGDLIEIQGITSVFQSSHTHNRPLIIGAAKSCIGHTETASGLVGVAKALKILEEKIVPGLTHIDETNINPAIDCSMVPLVISSKPVSLQPAEKHRGLVLSFGFAGTIAATVLESVRLQRSPSPPLTDRPEQSLFVVSAKNDAALQEYLRKYVVFCRSATEDSFESICYTSCVGREHYNLRISCIASSLTELVSMLECHLNEKKIVRKTVATNRRLIFAFPGQGLHFQGMGRRLCFFQGFKETLERAARVAADAVKCPELVEYLMGHDDKEDQLKAGGAEHTQLCTFVYQYALATWLDSIGIKAAGTVGHSLGEITAAVVAGIMSFEIGVDLVVKREALLRSADDVEGGMAVIALDANAVKDLFKSLQLNTLTIAVYNHTESHVVSGLSYEVDAFVHHCKASGLRAAKLNVRQGFHSSFINRGLPGLTTWSNARAGSFDTPKIQFISSVYGSALNSLPPHYWVTHAHKPVRFDLAVASILQDDPATVFIDMGPQPAIYTVLQNAPGTNTIVIPTSTKKSFSQVSALLSCLSTIFLLGVPLDFHKFYSNFRHLPPKVALPSYPFQRRRYYPSVCISRHRHTQQERALDVSSSTLYWEFDVQLQELLADHTVGSAKVLPAAAIVDFIQRVKPHQVIKQLNFHMPFIVQSGTSSLTFECTADGSFNLTGGGLIYSDCIASGIIAPLPSTSYPCDPLPTISSPVHHLSHEQIYLLLQGIEFGPRFRNIQSIIAWDTHADAIINIPSCNDSAINMRLRVLDPLFHGMGALAMFLHGQELETLLEGDNIFLPSALRGLVFHTSWLPSSIMCRYRLPIVMEQDSRLVSVSFEVFSQNGDILISCERYSVASIPQVLLGRNTNTTSSTSQMTPLCLDYAWKEMQSGPISPCSADLVLHVGLPESQLRSVCRLVWPDASILSFTIGISHTTPSDESLAAVLSQCGTQPIFLVIDLTDIEGTDCLLLHDVVTLLKSFSHNKTNIAQLLSFTTGATPVELTGGPLSASLGPVFHGMMGVFRREAGLTLASRLVDLPPSKPVAASELLHILQFEAQFPDEQATPTTAAWRWKNTKSLVRLVPTLISSPARPKLSSTIFGVVVIVGMGSIGQALASNLSRRQRSQQIVFLGRRPSTDPHVVDYLSGYSNVEYIQADVCFSHEVAAALNSITARHGPIYSIIHTAAVVEDSRIDNLTYQSLNRVLEPKFSGALNLHLQSSKLAIPIHSLVLMSSISVPLGNAGQAAYVGANSFLDWLAGHRQSQGLPTISLQLGPWESTILESEPIKQQLVHDAIPMTFHETGIPLILNFIKDPSGPPVRLISRFNLGLCSHNPTFYLDSLFENLLEGYTRNVAGKPMCNFEEAFIEHLRSILQLEDDDPIPDLSEPLVSLGVDSISFALLRGKILKDLGIDLPLKFLSESYSTYEIIQSFV